MQQQIHCTIFVWIIEPKYHKTDVLRCVFLAAVRSEQHKKKLKRNHSEVFGIIF